jgi:hypothetical protein
MEGAMKVIRHGQHYRSRAEECRTLASWFDNEEARIKMLKVADDYDRMAEVAEMLSKVKDQQRRMV